MTEPTINLYRRALAAFSINRYVVYSITNKIIDTDFVMDGDIVLSDAEEHVEHGLYDGLVLVHDEKRVIHNHDEEDHNEKDHA